MKKLLFLLSLLCCVAFAQQNMPKIAVYVATSELKDAEKKMLSTKILAPFVQSKQYIAIERSDAFLSGIARERQKQRDGSVDDKQLSRLGKEAGVQFVCVADLVDAFGIYSVSARLIDTETAQIVGMGEYEMNNLGEIGKAADEIFRQISGSSVVRSTQHSDKNDLELEKQRNALELEKQRTALELEKQRNALELERQKAALERERANASSSTNTSNSYKNFSAAERWGTWAVNALTINGLGSWVFMGDVWGGIVHLGLGVATVVSLIDAVDVEDEEVCSDYYDYYSGYYSYCNYEPVTVDLTWFAVFYLTGAIWNIYRSMTYDKPNHSASLIDPSHFNLAILPNRKGDGMAYGLKYNLKF